MYPYASKVKLGQVTLNVLDLERQKAFYQDIMGFQVLSQSDNRVILGSAEPLLELVQVAEADPGTYGLYHVAYLYPSRKDLGDLLRHLLAKQVPLSGGADHGYSEAIYFNDPEGNGIEIYQDKDQTQWDMRPDGRIIGVTEELDATGILALAQEQAVYQTATGTSIGHVHLSVRQALETSQHYQKLFQMDDKFSVPSGSWIASGTYHHHLAFNEWAGSDLRAKDPKKAGLASFRVLVSDFADLRDRLVDLPFQVVESGETRLLLQDPNGIVVEIVETL